MAWRVLFTCFVVALICGCRTADADRHSVSRSSFSWDPFLDTLQSRTIRFFLDATDGKSGLTPDRYPSSSPSSIAAVGFALTSYPIAAEHGITSRAEAAERARTTLRTLVSLPQGEQRSGTGGFKGLFYHFVDAGKGMRVWNCELSTIDTGLLMAGILFVQSYFNHSDPAEEQIRTIADSLYRRVDWLWAMDDTTGLLLGWTPEHGYIGSTWHGYDEAMLLYILALGSPTHPVPPSVWDHWTSTYKWAPYLGSEFVSFGPLFGHQYSHCWIDYRGIQDSFMRSRGIDYFENSRRATYTHRIYAIQNPRNWRDYSEDIWGFSACDGPGYRVVDIDGVKKTFLAYGARGVSFDWVSDDGTIAPTAVGGSVAFAPEICVPALKAMRAKYGERLWREYGFVDSFNPSFPNIEKGQQGWFDHDYIGIDQGPIVIMIENLRNGFVWEVMKTNQYIVLGLQRAGFTGGWLSSAGNVSK
jgi:hypothetical protein